MPTGQSLCSLTNHLPLIRLDKDGLRPTERLLGEFVWSFHLLRARTSHQKMDITRINEITTQGENMVLFVRICRIWRWKKKRPASDCWPPICPDRQSDLSRLTWILSPSRGSFMSRFLYSCVHMEMHTVSSAAADSDSLKCSLVESLVAQTAVLADKSLLFLLLLVWSSPNENNVFPYPVRTDQRFPTSDLNTVKEPDAENNDAGEAEDDNDGDGDDDDDEDEDNDEDDGNDSEDDSDDDEEDSDGELQAAGYGDSDDDDEDNDADDDSDEDDDSDDEDDEEQYKLPSQRKK